MILVCILIVVVLLLIYYYTPPRVDINVDGRKWSVVEDYENKLAAAKMLSELHDRMVIFMRYLRDKYHIDETDDVIAGSGDSMSSEGIGSSGTTTSDDVNKIVDTLLDNYNPDVFFENDPRYSSDTSYTLNKGDSMYICLRKRDDPRQLEDIELVFFVMLHECAHIANYNGWGHNDRYWTVFKFILQEAVLSGVYKPIDFDKHPQVYCGLKIFYNPLNDATLPSLV
jgi:WLM domain